MSFRRFRKEARRDVIADARISWPTAEPPTESHLVCARNGSSQERCTEEMGCCGETTRMRLQAWTVWGKIHRLLLTMLNHEKQLQRETVIIESTQVCAVGSGEATGRSPVDRERKRTKFTLLVDSDGVPLVNRAAEANQSDYREINRAGLPRYRWQAGTSAHTSETLDRPQDFFDLDDRYLIDINGAPNRSNGGT